MHWTAMLAYRRIPADARVIGDVECINCGYNLRGLRASGRCPECGSAVGDSLYLLTRPEIVAQSLRNIANSYLTVLALIMGCLGIAGGWPLIVIAAMIAFGAGYRALSAGELRYRADLGNAAVLCRRARLLWLASLLELSAALMWLLAAIASVKSAVGAADVLFVTGSLAWLALSLVTAAAAGWFGLALSTALRYGWMIIEFKVQLAMTASSVAALALAGTMVFTAPRGFPLTIVVALLFMFPLLGIGVTWISLHHLANAAEQARDILDEVLESDGMGAALPPMPVRPAREAPAIDLAPPKPPKPGPDSQAAARPKGPPRPK